VFLQNNSELLCKRERVPDCDNRRQKLRDGIFYTAIINTFPEAKSVRKWFMSWKHR